MNLPHPRPARRRTAALGRVLAAACLLACGPPAAPRPDAAAPATADTLHGWLQMVWAAPGSPAYALTDSAGRTTPLLISDSLAAAARVRALDRGWVRVIADVSPGTGAVRVREIGAAPPPAAP